MIDSVEAQKVISRYRNSAAVVATYTCNREWPQVSTNPSLDLLFAGGMGKASSLGLGLALARPDKKIIVLDGDGSLLMNLGSLVTIAHMAPANLIHFVFENSVYRTTGGQPIPGASILSFVGIAQSAGYVKAYEFETLKDFENSIESIMNLKGPIFICLKIVPNKMRSPLPYTKTTLSLISLFQHTLDASCQSE